MKHQRPLPILFGLLIWLNSCETFNQNDFIESGKIADVENKVLLYDLYQTGIDNYRYEIKLIENQDTTDLFTAHLNDATASNSSFSIEDSNSVMIIRVNKPIGGQEKLIYGQTFRLEGIK